MTTFDPAHRHDQAHRGFVPMVQLAEGTPTVGYVPISDGGSNATWGPMEGGGGECDHEHTYERFVAEGGTPETFTLAYPPLYPVDVRINGSSADPDDVTLTGSDVDVETEAADVVVIWYARECGSVPPDDVVVTEIQVGSDEQNAIFEVVVNLVAGTYDLRYIVPFFTDDYTVTGIPFNTDAADLQTALASGAYPGSPDPNYFDVTGSGSIGDPFVVEFIGTYALQVATLEVA